jgi:FkbM family methyltransferase
MKRIIKAIPFSIRERIRVLIFGRSHHKDLISFMSATAGAVMFDVGAESGYETILAANAGMKVYAFEPDPRSIEALKANIEMEGLHGVEVIEKAVADFDGRAELFFGVHSTLIPTNATSATVEVTTLASFISAAGICDFLKIDAEGANMKVLKGYPFEVHKPSLISVEYEDDGNEIVSLLRRQGYWVMYALYRPVNRLRRAIFWKYSLLPEFDNGVWGDIVAVRPDKLPAFSPLVGRFLKRKICRCECNYVYSHQ